MIQLENTHGKLKTRMNQYFKETKDLMNKNIMLDTFVRYFAIHHIEKNKTEALEDIQKEVKMKMIWQGKPISCNRLFDKINFC